MSILHLPPKQCKHFLLFVLFLLSLLIVAPGFVEAASRVKGVKISHTRPVFNPVTQTYDSYLTLTNKSKKTINGPLAILISRITKKNISVAEPAGTIKNKAYLYLPLPNGVLAPQQTLSDIVVRFSNPSQKKFNFSNVLITNLDGFKPAPFNHLPVADAGSDQAITINTLVQLDGSASVEPDGQSLTYRWALGQKPLNSTAEIIQADQPRPTITPDQPGRYIAQLIVNDGQIDSFPDTVVLDTGNIAPVARLEADKTALPGSVLNLDGSNSFDANGDLLTYNWSLKKPKGSKAKLLPADTETASIKLDKRGNYLARLQVNDGTSNSNPATIKLSTTGSTPQANAGVDQLNLAVDQAIHLSGESSSDSDQQSLSYRWSLLYKPTGSNTQLTQTQQVDTELTPDLLGDYIAQLIVNDGQNTSNPDTVLLNVGDSSTGGTNGPQITSSPITLATVGTPYNSDIDAIDAGNNTLSYQLVSSPSGMLIDSDNGLISWTPEVGQIGSHPVKVRVSNGKGGEASQSFTITVNAAEQTSIPSLIDQNRAYAETAIQQARLKVGSLSFQHSDKTDGSVISQSLTAGSSVAIGTAVNLTISLGPDTGLPPNPATVAPTLDATVAATTYSSTQFLYTGSNPVQTGVAEGTIKPERVAVIRGRVLDKQNSPLSGVTVSILNHPEYGQTLSRIDGQFDLAVNGGGLLTVHYHRTGYIPSQRSVNAPWQDFVWAEDIVMTAFDPVVTRVDFSLSQMQVARGSQQSDADGERQATIMIPAGTTAEMLLPDGSSQMLPSIDLRATEVTVGENGPSAMSAPLPAGSGYTYAAEFSIDQAVAADAREVRFNQALPTYVENFLGFPVGTAVPSGYYDRQKGQWVASQNGRVIKILSITNGQANLDLDGTDVAADAAALDSLGITVAELTQLAQLYVPGQSLWRVPLDHFSFWDFNWPYGLPDDAQPPPPPDDDEPEEDQSKQCGSIIGCQNQTLGESIAIAGTPFRLHYQSERTPGRKEAYTLDIPLTGENSPSKDLHMVVVNVNIAGKRYQKSFLGDVRGEDSYVCPKNGISSCHWITEYLFSPNLKHTIHWDGTDAYGRKVLGSLVATIKVFYLYTPQYYSVRSEFNNSFARAEAAGLKQVDVSRSASIITVQKTWTKKLHIYDARNLGLGGFSLNNQHVFDNGTLWQGNGERRFAESINKIDHTVAGASNHTTYREGMLATNADLLDPDIAIASDGSLYIADGNSYAILRVDTDGTIHHVTGKGSKLGDGIPAIEADLRARPNKIEVAPDGSLYFIEGGSAYGSAIRRIGTDGIISTVAGIFNASPNFYTEGIKATDAIFRAYDITVDPDGNLYISSNFGILRVGTDGMITTVFASSFVRDMDYGNDSLYYVEGHGIYRLRLQDGDITRIAGGAPFSRDDGIPALEADVSYPAVVTYSPDGGVYYTAGNRIRHIGTNGIVNTVRNFGTRDMAFSPDGILNYSTKDYVRKFHNPLPENFLSEIILPSEDGSEVYIFTPGGQLYQTLDALTGTVLYQFGYDTAGYITSVTDVNGDMTKIERSGVVPMAIIAADGQRTDLNINSQGWLTQVTNPEGEAHRMKYSDDGLLLQFIKPLNTVHQFSYDEGGRLIKDQNPAGGSISIDRVENGSTYEVITSTALGRSRKYQVEKLPDGSSKRTNTSPDGTQSIAWTYADGNEQTISSDGTSTLVRYGADPRLGTVAPIISSIESISGGKTLSLTASREVQLADPNNLFSVVSQTDTVTVNGKTSTSTYHADTRQTVSTSAEGRKKTRTDDAQGRPIAYEVPGIEPIHMIYDERGRMKTLVQGERNTHFTYDVNGYLGQITNSLGQQTAFTNDLLGRVTQQVTKAGDIIGFSYDANGNVKSVTPPEKPEHLFNYTSIDQVESYLPPVIGNGGNTSYLYDLDKDLTLITRPDNKSVKYNYDNAGRLSELVIPRGTYTYSYNGVGKLEKITTPNNNDLSYTYNGVFLSDMSWSGEISGTVEFDYDNDFRVQSININGLGAINYAYDADGLLVQAGDLALNYSTKNTLLLSTVLNNVSNTYQYNAYGEIQNSQVKENDNLVFDVNYSHDALGRITEKTETIGGLTTAYQYAYDATGQLVSVKQNGILRSSYTYDANRNRLSKTSGGMITSATYDDQDRLLTYGATSYAYTPNGEVSSKTNNGVTTHYTYDMLGNLIQAKLPGDITIDYVIDGKNRRVGKKVNGTLVQGLLYQDQLNPVAELDGNGNIVSQFIYGKKANVPEYMIKNGTTYRFITDQLGSPRLVINAETGDIVQKLKYDEFGTIIQDSNPGFQPFGFAGGLYDVHTGLTRFGLRDYAPAVGRWMSKDPILFGGGHANIYAYVSNDPVNFIDILGLASNKCSEKDKARPRPRSRSKEEAEANAGVNSLMGKAGKSIYKGIKSCIQAGFSSKKGLNCAKDLGKSVLDSAVVIGVVTNRANERILNGMEGFEELEVSPDSEPFDGANFNDVVPDIPEPPGFDEHGDDIFTPFPQS